MAGSPFDPPSGPSILAGDPQFKRLRSGLTRSQLASRTVKQRTAAAGTSPGQIWGLSEKADKQLVVRPKKAKR